MAGCLLSCCLSTQEAAGQQYPVYSQYLYNGLVINPAFAGSDVQMSITAMYRNQWVNFEGAPKTLTLTGHTSIMKNRIGVGLLLTDDRIGSYSNKNVYGSYAYILPTPAGKLSMGLQAGFNLISANFDDLDLNNPGDAAFANITNQLKPNFGAGVYFSNDYFYAGFSVPFILNSGFDNADFESISAEIKSARYYYLNGGINIPLSRLETIILRPSTLIRAQEGQPLSIDLNVETVFNEVFSLGVSYRNIDAIITFINLKLTDQLHFAYAYDWTTSDIARFSNGTHEFVLNYRFRIRKLHGNVECPSYFQF